MKYLGFLFKNLTRNRIRSILTISSIAASLFLVATLLAILFSLTSPPETPDSALRLVTRHKISIMNTLPKSYREKIAAVEGVESVIGSMWFGGLYNQNGTDVLIAQFAVDTDELFSVNPDMAMPEDQKISFIKDRAGAIAGRVLADRFGWKVGDTIHTRSNIFPVKVELALRGIYEGGGDQGGSLYFHWEYFNEAINDQGFTGTYSIRARSAEDVPRIAKKVDDLFVNTTTPTQTETEKAFMLSFVSMMGNVQLLISSICLAVIFAIVLIAATTMAMSIRERVREIGILKTLGFRSRHILTLLLSEALVITLGGALLGVSAARVLFSSVDMAQASGGFMQPFNVTPTVFAICAALGILIGILSAGVPAWRASQRSVVDALRNIA